MTIEFSTHAAFSSSETAGFSLVELAIVLVIVALLAGGVTGGMAIRHNLELQNVMKDVSMLAKATEQFNTMYGGLPGDLWNATEKFGVSNTINGNGNGVIDTAGEQALAFQQLGLAGLIKGSYPSTWTSQSAMPGSLPNSTFFFGSLNNAASISFAAMGATQANRIAVLSPGDMLQIDKKYDDGLPNSGTIRAFTGDGATSPCITADSYNTASDTVSCYFTVIIRKAFQ